MNLCSMSSHEISSLINIPKFHTQFHFQWILRCIVRRCRQLSADSTTTGLQTSCALHISSRTVCRELLRLAIWWMTLGLAVGERYLYEYVKLDGVLWCGVVFQAQWKLFLMLRISTHFGQFHTLNFAGKIWGWKPSCSNMTAHQCKKQGPQGNR